MKHLLFIFISCCLTGCTEWNGFSSEKIEQTYDKLENFEQIHVDGLYKVELIQSENPKVVFRGTEKQHKSLSISVKEKKLNIGSKKTNPLSSSYSKAKLEIHQDSINQLWVYEPVDLYSKDTIKADKFSLIYYCELADTDITIDTRIFRVISMNGTAGKFNFKGQSQTFFIRLRGASSVNAKNLQARQVSIQQISIGDIFVNSQEKLKVISFNSGDVYYTGDPQEIEIELNSTGKVFNLQ